MLIALFFQSILHFQLSATRSHLKNRILAQGQGRTEFQPAGILKYVEDLKRGPNTEIGEKDFFEIASNQKSGGWGICDVFKKNAIFQ
jgi:hypothetical protein